MKSEQIKAAAAVIRRGGLVAFPTETVYGLGANALDPVAVARIFELKERPSFDPLIVHIASWDDLSLLTTGPVPGVRELAMRFWPGPLTIILPKSARVPEIVTAGLPTVGVRMPDHETALQLISEAGCPIAAPSANKFGKLSPVTANHVRKQLPETDFILDGGTTRVGIESTIVALDGNVCTLLRPGVITLAEIREALPSEFVVSVRNNGNMISPGLLKSHYSPLKPLFLVRDLSVSLPRGSGLIVHEQKNTLPPCEKLILTSETCNYREIAANLFSALHAMEDDERVRRIFIEPVPETGLGTAIMDRLKRAAYQYQSN
jgi:L-threonylcarbamoyladenylate synthase